MFRHGKKTHHLAILSSQNILSSETHERKNHIESGQTNTVHGMTKNRCKQDKYQTVVQKAGSNARSGSFFFF